MQGKLIVKALINKIREHHYDLVEADLTPEEEDLFNLLSKARNSVNNLVKHCDGTIYLVTGFSEDLETEEQYVLLKKLSASSKTYSIQIDKFLEKADKEKYTDIDEEHEYVFQPITLMSEEEQKHSK